MMRRCLNNCGTYNIFVRMPVTICDNDGVFPKLIKHFILRNFIFFYVLRLCAFPRSWREKKQMQHFNLENMQREKGDI
jgi:hypothetical protein